MNQKNKTYQKNNIDQIVSEIIPDYNKKISIKLEHVDLTFNVTSEKIDTLKETVIRTIKREKTKKNKSACIK